MISQVDRAKALEALQLWHANNDLSDGYIAIQLVVALEAILKHNPQELVLYAEMFNGFTVEVSGNEAAIDVLKGRLIQDVLVKSIRIFDPAKGDYVAKLNYTQLKEARKK